MKKYFFLTPIRIIDDNNSYIIYLDFYNKEIFDKNLEPLSYEDYSFIFDNLNNNNKNLLEKVKIPDSILEKANKNKEELEKYKNIDEM